MSAVIVSSPNDETKKCVKRWSEKRYGKKRSKKEKFYRTVNRIKHNKREMFEKDLMWKPFENLV